MDEGSLLLDQLVFDDFFPFWLVGWGLVVIFPSSLIFLPNSAPLCFFLFQAVLVASCVQASYNFRIICVFSRRRV